MVGGYTASVSPASASRRTHETLIVERTSSSSRPVVSGSARSTRAR